ncbi:MAG: 16S rRNA (guanine(966)-N(2))-methyltransferase RsmD [Campylobacteraceae bacterium]|nr:16S rRNA (guanine(966)-N(2))-methyltransferase RsmD [Campylobacteraceae bacterium]
MAQKNLYTIVTAGKFKGKKLLLPSHETTRSTKAILKSSFFNTVQFDIQDSCFVEAFAGSGSMGLEALSRGAKKVYFIEKERAAFDILKRNCESLDKDKSVCFLGDTFVKLHEIAQSLEEAAFFYFDPPFDIREGMGDIYEKSIKLLASLPSSKVKIAAFEHISSFKMPKSINGFELFKSKTFGNSSLSFYNCEDNV